MNIIMSRDKELCDGCGNVDYTVDTVEEKGFIDRLVELIRKIGV